MGGSFGKTRPAPVRNEDEEASPLPGADAGQGAACASEGSPAHTLGTWTGGGLLPRALRVPGELDVPAPGHRPAAVGALDRDGAFPVLEGDVELLAGEQRSDGEVQLFRRDPQAPARRIARAGARASPVIEDFHGEVAKSEGARRSVRVYDAAAARRVGASAGVAEPVEHE